MKLLELRPFAARLTTSTPSFASRRNPGPQPDCSATVESPTRTMRIAAAFDWAARGEIPSARRTVGAAIEATVIRRITDMRIIVPRSRARVKQAHGFNDSAIRRFKDSRIGDSKD